MKNVQKIPVNTAPLFRVSSQAVPVIFALCLLLPAIASTQEIFRWVDKDGKVHYGDMLPLPTEEKNVQTKKMKDSVIEQDAVSYGVSTAMKNNPVTLYANSCGDQCTNAKALLARRGIPFAERNPESDVAAAIALKALAGTLAVPTIAIGANSIQGFEEESWNSALSAAGYPRNNPTIRQSAVKAGARDVPSEPAK